jgi:hypothetical protein
MDNQDWILKQMDAIALGFGLLLKKEISSINLGEIKDEHGKSTSVRELIVKYMDEKKYDEAFYLVNSLKYKLSYYDFEVVSNWFISNLNLGIQNGNINLDQLKISQYSEKLRNLL